MSIAFANRVRSAWRTASRTYLFDSDVIIDALRSHPTGLARIRRLAGYGLAISVITYGELTDGVHRVRDVPAARARLAEALLPFRMLGVDREIAEIYGRSRADLARSGNQIPDNDLLIAATALHLDLTIVTRNVRHFGRLHGLRIYADAP